jgi:hypothetical protein
MLGNLAEQEVGRTPGVDHCLDRHRLLVDLVSDEFHLLTALALEGGDEFADRSILGRGEALLPPHHEVSGPRVERC